MCGIVGFTGLKPAAPILLDGLKRLEYRGYDSAGIAVFKDNHITVKKAQGRLDTLCKLIDDGKGFDSTIGIGHTRWATHGKPSDVNAHPHISNDGNFAIVHNGIIENYATLKDELIKKGYVFASETDTEVIAHLLQDNYDGDMLSTVSKTIAMLKGSYALGIISKYEPDVLYAVRFASPLIVGVSESGNMIASDIPAILPVTRDIMYLNDDEIVRLTKEKVEVFDSSLNPVEKQIKTIEWDVSAAEKGGYDHFMIKEIMEQPKALRDTIAPRIKDGDIVLDDVELTKEMLEKFNRICIVACGSAYHVGVVAKYAIEKLVRIPTEAVVASEFRYSDPLVDENTLVIIISQSGETADTLEALKLAKRKGSTIISIVNVVGSSIANESQNVIYTWAGPEISVATTKAYSTQLIVMYLLILYIGKKLGRIDKATFDSYLEEIQRLPDKVEQILKQSGEIEKLAQRYAFLEHAYFIGRNIDYAVSLEASLKLKETSYIHSDAYPAGELKHGPISLIEDDTLVVALACNERLMPKTLSNVKEVKARGAEVLMVTNDNMLNADIKNSGLNKIITIPSTFELLTATLEVVPMQLLGYYIAKARECDVDKPRNLAKSVTVE
ncbi:MAG: glutamine--fructose-6-phosphate transaminase (isomerizing) [Acutalibacteraceae bacterium]